MHTLLISHKSLRHHSCSGSCWWPKDEQQLKRWEKISKDSFKYIKKILIYKLKQKFILYILLLKKTFFCLSVNSSAVHSIHSYHLIVCEHSSTEMQKGQTSSAASLSSICFFLEKLEEVHQSPIESNVMKSSDVHSFKNH